MYDWANSAFSTTVVAAVFPAFFTAVAAAGLTPQQASARYTAATVIAVVVAALLSPVLGAIADVHPVKKRLLAVFLGVGVISTGCMFLIQEGAWLLASLLFIGGNIGAMGSYVFYDAILPHVASSKEMDRVSTAGYALGYLGGGVLLAINLAWILFPGFFGFPSGEGLSSAEATLPIRLSLLSVAVWWGLFAIPLFLRIPEPALSRVPERVREARPVRAAFRRMSETFRELRRYRNAFLMLLAYLVYSDGIGTIIRMAVFYGGTIGIGRDWMIGAILLTQFVGVPCSFLFGWMAGRIGAKRSIFLGLGVYAGISIIGYFMATHWHFILLAVLVGIVQGGTQALSRSLFASMIPPSKSGEFFGLYGVMDRFSGSVGTGMIGILAALGLPLRVGILAVIVLFAAGAGILTMVRVEEGREAAHGHAPG